MEFDNEIFAERLKKLRKSRGLTTSQLALATKTTDGTVSRWENALVIPKVDSIFLLVKFFGVSAGYLIGTED